MRVHVVDPSAYTPPYDHALCRALGVARPDMAVELFTSRFAYDRVAAPEHYQRRELFYRLAHRGAASGPRSRLRLALKAAEHVPDMLRYRRAARAADVVHFQWLTVQPLDVHLLPRRRVVPGAGSRPKRVLTAHDVLPREPRPGQLRAQRRLYERMDAVVVHSEHGRRRLTDELGLAADLVHVIPHGVLRPWEEVPGEHSGALPREFADATGPVVLFLGLLRPYKGLDVLLDAWRQTARGAADGGAGVGDAELWIVGMPRMELGALLAAARAAEDAGAGRVRFLPRFVSARETEAFMRRASLAVLPYREIDQSGVLFTALGAGTPLLLSDAGGFPEVARTGAARMVPSGDPAALAVALSELLGDPAALAALREGAAAAVAGRYSWSAIAAAHLALYERLLGT
jgi:glycosyltransferase involved in cell wall biosynthesis